jgi:predicted DNA-binding transcriptional regulator YafY
MTAMEAIQQAARSLHTVNIQYTDAKGSGSQREVEPYSFRPGKDPGSLRFFAFDPSKNSIRGFRMDRVAVAEVTNNTYVPRWVVEI